MTLNDIQKVLEKNNVYGNIPMLEVQLTEKIIKFAINGEGNIKFQIQDNSKSLKVDIEFILEEKETISNKKYIIYFYKSYCNNNPSEIKDYNKSYSNFDDAIIETIKNLKYWF